MNAKLDNNKNSSEASLRLLMYTAMPARDSAFEAGFEAACNNHAIEENPFQAGEQEYDCWENGWWAGFYEEDYLTDDFISELKAYSELEAKVIKGRERAQSSHIKNTQKKSHPNEIKSSFHNKVGAILSWFAEHPRFKKALLIASVLLATMLSFNLLLIE